MTVATVIIMMEKGLPTSEEQQQTCFSCEYFQMKQWDIGYCRLHQVNVLQSYSCSKFVPEERNPDVNEHYTGVE
jgi:hypothetical protein